MSNDVWFSICNFGVLPFWILLAVAPRWQVTHWLVNSCIASLALAAVYGLKLFTAMPGAEGSFSSLQGVEELFLNDSLLLAGWIHYLAFDLFIGAWEVRNARAIGIPHWQVIPCLFFTFMLGPIGLLLYFVLRFAYQQWLIPSDGSAG